MIDAQELQNLASRLTAAGMTVMQIHTTAVDLPAGEIYRRSNRDVVITSDGTEHAIDGGTQ